MLPSAPRCTLSLIAALLFTAGLATAPAEQFLSCPPQRPRPQPSTRPLTNGPVHFVDPVHGNDTADGTKEQPWQTIRQALPRLNAVADPKFVSFPADFHQTLDLRLKADSPALHSGVPLPAEWPDPLRSKDGTAPDIGALPGGSAPLKVGIDDRTEAGAVRTPFQ